MPTPDLDRWKTWDPRAQRIAVQRLSDLGLDTWRPFYCPEPGCRGRPHGDWAWNHARADQRPPSLTSDWDVWLLKAGRGSGKTRAAAEFTHQMTRIAPRIALVAPTGPDLRDIVVEGESGILATARPGHRPQWEPSKKRLTWPNGAVGYGYSAEEPDRLRGPQHHFAWVEEAAHMPLIVDVWDNLILGLRLGRHPRTVVTTTPTPIKWLKNLIKGEELHCVVSHSSTYDNLDNLAEPFKRVILAKYEGTRLGRQELHGEILTDVVGALWTWDLIENNRVLTAPALDRVVVGVDPAGSANRRSDETGIIVIGRAGEHYYVIADGSGVKTPGAWARATMNLHDFHEADAVVAEKNYGGDMVKHTLRTVDAFPRIKMVGSRRGKQLRAEPVVALYEQGRIHHVGLFPDLESQMTEWVPGETDSPDRVDALVHGITDLARGHGAAVQFASPTDLPRLTVLQGGRSA